MKFARWAAFLSVFTLLLITGKARAVDWPAITPEELSMTSIKEQPGAPAVVLQREEVDDDMNNFHSVYERIKVLTEAGRENANVEIPYRRRGFNIDGISGRTVHSDGSVVQLQAKPFDKTVIKEGDLKINVKSFSMPDVQVGSILEYRYTLRYQDHMVLPPTWQVQTNLFQRKAYFKFIPFQNHGNMDVMLPHGQIANGIAWAPFLGNGGHPELHEIPRASIGTNGFVSSWVDLNIDNVPAFIEEPYMPPPDFLRWRVYFYYQQNLNMEDYWKSEGKYWNKEVEGFVGGGRGISDVVGKVIQASDTPEQKVRKIYSFVTGLENQDYIPERSKQENKVLELKINKGAEDVVNHRSGTHDDLNRLFVSMVRAAGIPASLIWVPDRSQEIYLKQYLSTDQFSAEIAIVQLDGKDVFLDPGTKYCPYGIVDWRYTGVEGLRQSPKGADIGKTPSPTYTESITTRMARVSLDERGMVSGTVSLVFKGSPAMHFRQSGAKTDVEGRKKLLEDEVREILPGNSEITVTKSPDWDNPENPLVVQYHVSCPFAVAAGKRLMLQQQLFQVNEKARFTAAERQNAVYFQMPWQEADEVHITIPAGMELESLAPDDSVKTDFAIYKVQHKREAPDTIFVRRDLVMGAAVFGKNEYKQIKEFFEKVKADDDQPALVRSSQSVANAK